MSENKFELIIENGVVKGYKGQSKVVEIPEGVTEIGEFVFQECDFIEEVYSKSTTLKTIGMGAFERCSNMKICQLDSLKGSIENSAFCGCELLKHFVVPNGTIKIGNCAFDDCKNMLYIIIPSSVFIIEGYILEIGNKKTVILGELGSEAEEYANKKMIPFKENTQATRNEFLQLENKKDNTGYKDFNVFGETVRGYKSVVVYQELLDFFRNLNDEFSKDVLGHISMEITKLNENAKNLPYLSQRYAEKTNKFLQKHGVFISDSIFAAKTMEYNANYIEICQTYIDAYKEIVNTAQSGTDVLKSNLIAEAESKVTGLSYGVIGDSLTLAAYAIDEYRAEKRQRKEAYAVAQTKMQEGRGAILNQAQSIYTNLLNETILPAFDKSVDYICDGLMKLTIDEMIETKVIDKNVFELYDIVKSKKITEQVKVNSNIDKKYAIATALKLYPLNIDAISLAVKNKLVEKDLITLIEFYNYGSNVNVISAFRNSYTYIELVTFHKNNILLLKDELGASVNRLITEKAKDLLDQINVDYDPMQIDADTWNDLVRKYDIIYPSNKSRYNISEDEVKGPNGRELLSKAIGVAREEKRKADEIRKQKLHEQNLANVKKALDAKRAREEKERLARKKVQEEKEQKKKKIKAIFAAVIIFILVILGCCLAVWFIIIPNKLYNNAMGFISENNHIDALKQLNLIDSSYKDSDLKKQECYYYIAKDYEESNKIKHAAVAYGKAGDYKDAKEHAKILWDSFAKRNTIDSGFDHIVSLKQDGSVVAAGRNDEGECNTDNWTDVIAIAAGDGHTVGLKSDGSVVVTGDTKGRNQNIIKWNNVVEIHACGFTTVGLKSDGTVVAEGNFKQNEYEKIHSWTDIVEVYVDSSSLAGLKSDGTVVAVGDFEQVEYEKICSWSDISKVAIYGETLVGLKSDGTVVVVGDFEQTEYELILNWTDIVDIYTNGINIVGLKSNGMVVAEGSLYGDEYKEIHSWTNVVDLSVTRGGFGGNIIGLKSDGTVVAVGDFEEDVHKKIRNVTDIVKLNVYYDEFIGLRSDGTVVIFDTFYEHFESLINWTNIIGIYGNSKIFVALKSDGTTVVAGYLDIYGSFDDWDNIIIQNDSVLSNRNN